MAARTVFQSFDPNTAYSEFAIKREQKVGKNSGSTYNTDRGYSPVSRWFAYAFQYSDFVSNTVGAGYMCECPVPNNSIVLRVMIRVDTAFTGTGTDAVDVGTGGTRDAAPGDGWGENLDLQSTGLKYDPDADYNPGGSSGAQFYSSGDTIDVYNTPGQPTAGKGIMFIEVISYHEALNAEW